MISYDVPVCGKGLCASRHGSWAAEIGYGVSGGKQKAYAWPGGMVGDIAFGWLRCVS